MSVVNGRDLAEPVLRQIGNIAWTTQCRYTADLPAARQQALNRNHRRGQRTTSPGTGEALNQRRQDAYRLLSWVKIIA